MLASGVFALLWVTPNGAEHRGVRPKRQHQNDGENSCSKHDTLGRMEGKRRASLVETTDAYSLGVSCCSPETTALLQNFADWAPKIPHLSPDGIARDERGVSPSRTRLRIRKRLGPYLHARIDYTEESRRPPVHCQEQHVLISLLQPLRPVPEPC